MNTYRMIPRRLAETVMVLASQRNAPRHYPTQSRPAPMDEFFGTAGLTSSIAAAISPFKALTRFFSNWGIWWAGIIGFIIVFWVLWQICDCCCYLAAPAASSRGYVNLLASAMPGLRARILGGKRKRNPFWPRPPPQATYYSRAPSQEDGQEMVQRRGVEEGSVSDRRVALHSSRSPIIRPKEITATRRGRSRSRSPGRRVLEGLLREASRLSRSRSRSKSPKSTSRGRSRSKSPLLSFVRAAASRAASISPGRRSKSPGTGPRRASPGPSRPTTSRPQPEQPTSKDTSAAASQLPPRSGSITQRGPAIPIPPAPPAPPALHIPDSYRQLRKAVVAAGGRPSGSLSERATTDGSTTEAETTVSQAGAGPRSRSDSTSQRVSISNPAVTGVRAFSPSQAVHQSQLPLVDAGTLAERAGEMRRRREAKEETARAFRATDSYEDSSS